MARLAIGKEFLAEYAKLDRDSRSAVDTAIAEFARQAHAGPSLETPRDSRDSRIRTIGIDGVWRGVVLAPDSGDTYRLLTVLPQEKVNDFAASRRFGFELSTVYQITPPKPEWQPHFQVRVLSEYQPRLRGMFTYPEPFDRT